ncbi:MAG: hypothetical protein HOO96_36590 [Polyangiaceae bacterium]|nr:hypothetical protein [Polyangiaceae bacterium]
MKKLGWLVIAAAVVAPLASVADAEACGGAIWRESNERPKAKPTPAALVAKAEKSMEDGKGDVAVKTVLEAYPKLEKAAAGKDAMANRALRLAAVAAVRSNGDQSVVGAKAPVSYFDYDYGQDVNVPAKLQAPKTAEDRTARLEWSIKALRSLHEQSPNNPTITGELGEALAATPGHETEALELLSQLSDKDLLGTPQAYSALARLRFQQGLTKKSAEALQRCNAMTNKPAVCGPQLPTNPA